jgi:hypothetical protein
MRIAKTILASAAAVGLAATPIAAQAAPARSASHAAQGENLAGGNATVYIAVAAFVIAIAVILATSDNGHKLPVSP